MGTDGERAALVSGRSLYTEETGGNRDGVGVTGGDEEDETEADSGDAGVTAGIPNQPHPHNILGQFHEDALTQVGVGSYQWLICATAGFCIMADGVQLFMIPYLETSIQAEMCLDEDRRKWLFGISILGLFVGSFACPLADHIGRRSLLLFGLSLHLIFNIAAAFTPTLGIFMFSLFCGAVGLGLCYPVAGIYFAEFLPQVARGRLLFLLIFWALGGFNVILFASTLLPTTGEEIMYEVKEHQSAWHRVLLLSCLPTVFALASLSCVSESIRYLLHAGRDVNAIMMYQQMYKWNASKSAQYQLTELELPSKVNTAKPPPAKSVWNQMTFNFKQFSDSIKELFQRQNLMSFVLLSLVWAALGFSYYGLGVWIPDRIKYYAEEHYHSQEKVYQNMEEIGRLYVNDIENEKYVNVTFNSCVFAHITLIHVTFENCNFTRTEFSNILSSKTYFKNSLIEHSSFVDTDFTPERFINCDMINNTFFSLEAPCRTDLDFKLRQSDLMTENTVKLNCAFLAFALTVIWIGYMKRSKTGVLGMLFCSLATLSCWFLHDILSLLLFDFIWNLVFLISFNAVYIISIEAFPVNLRATGFGLCFSWFRLMGFFATMMTLNHYVLPMVVISLLIGGVALYRLPDTSHNLM